MIKIQLLSVLSVLFISVLSAQLQPQLSTKAPDHPVLTACYGAAPYAATILEEDLRRHLYVLASDSLQGRETGTEGQRMAAAYIASHFSRLGLPAVGDRDPETGELSHQQHFAYTSERWDRDKLLLEVNGQAYEFLKDFYSFPSENVELPLSEADEVLFLGYGIDDPAYSDYAGVDVSGKTLLIYAGEPLDEAGRSFITGDTSRAGWSRIREQKLETARKHGVQLLLIIDPQIKENIGNNRLQLFGGRKQMGWGNEAQDRYANSFYLSSSVARQIVGEAFDEFVAHRDRIRSEGKPASMRLPCALRIQQVKVVDQLTGSNVLGFVEGRDPVLKEEVVVVSAHYDHLGMRGNSIFNGADDNGSGTSTVLELAEAFAQAKKEGIGPRRSVLFLLVSGEEKGLLGSDYYATFPVFPLANTVADLNVDMIGRTDKNHEDDPRYIYVIGADRLSTTLHKINEAANQAFVNIQLDYTFNDERDPNRFYYRSDHYNFAKNGVPVIFYFSGVHADYHRPSDTPEKIMFDKMVPVGKLIFYTAWELANRDERIAVDVTGKE